MDLQHILGPVASNVYANSKEFMCVYDTERNRILSANPVLVCHIPDVTNMEVEFIFKTETDIYITLDKVPCRLNVLSLLKDKETSLMFIYPAHTKKWNNASDIVTLTDLTSDGVWDWYPSVDFEYMSERFWSILGYSQVDMGECPGSWMEMMNPDDTKPVMDLFSKHSESRGKSPYIIDVRYRHKDGHEVVILCRGSVIEWMPDGKPWRMLGTHTDITEIVKKDALESKSKFISRMSHEIRSPLCTILNECELLDENDRIGIIQDTCRQLISITNNILEIGNVRTMNMELCLSNENIPDILQKCTNRHRKEAEKKCIKVRVIMNEVPENVSIDLGKFNQVVDNLIGNSIKYSDKGRITLEVDYESDESILSILVTDEGIGMDPSFHVNAFEELTQGDSTMMGVGLGLTLCRTIARFLGGDVVIDKSSPGNGTTMLFTSKVNKVIPARKRYSFLEEMDLRVLIVDDIKTNREILRRRLETLSKKGVNVSEIVEAVNGEDALARFTDCRGNFQLVLMDCHMPILNGFDATVKIHEYCAQIRIEAVPVVAVTASISSDIFDRCKSVGMDYVVTKPYSELDLIASIRSCIESKHSSETGS